MMFSTKAEYGVRVMVGLARRASQTPDDTAAVVPLAEIAEHDGLPLAYLEHLVARLRKAGLVDSRRGSRGGYMLARPATQITMAEVVEALEGTIAPIECISQGPDGSIVCSRELNGSHQSQACPAKLLWTRVRFAIVRTLQETTLADLITGVADSAGKADSTGVADSPLTPPPALNPGALTTEPLTNEPLTTEPLTTEPLTNEPLRTGA